MVETSRPTAAAPKRQPAAGQDCRPVDLRAASCPDEPRSREARRDVERVDSPANRHPRAPHRRSRRGDVRSGEGSRDRRDAAGRRLADRHRLHRRRHDDARYDLSEHGVRAAAQDRRDRRLGIRPRRGVFGLHLRAHDRHADGRQRRARPRARRRRRRDVEHHRLHRPRHLRSLWRRRRRGGAVGG